MAAKKRRAQQGGLKQPSVDRRAPFATLWVKSRKSPSGLPVLESVTEDRMLPGCFSCTTHAPQESALPESDGKAQPFAKNLLPLAIYAAPQSEVHCGASVRDQQAVLGDLFSVVHGRHITDIRRLIRANSRDAGLVRLVPLEDIEQDVLLQVLSLVRRQPLSLFCDEKITLRLLACVVRRVVQQHARAHGRAKRDFRRTAKQASYPLVSFACHRTGSTLEALATRDQAQVLLARLPDLQRQVVCLRSEGLSWEKVSGEVGGTPDGCRMAFSRAVASLRRMVPEGAGRSVSN